MAQCYLELFKSFCSANTSERNQQTSLFFLLLCNLCSKIREVSIHPLSVFGISDHRICSNTFHTCPCSQSLRMVCWKPQEIESGNVWKYICMIAVYTKWPWLYYCISRFANDKKHWRPIVPIKCFRCLISKITKGKGTYVQHRMCKQAWFLYKEIYMQNE